MKIDATLWQRYYQQHRSLYEFINEHSQPLYVVPGHEPVYQTYQLRDGSSREKLPRFIHWIGRLNVDEESYQQRVAELEIAYKAAAGDRFRRYPVNHPELHRNVEQVNVSRHLAIKSEPVTGQRLYLVTKLLPESNVNQASLREQLEELARKLKAVGLPAMVSTVCLPGVRGLAVDHLALSVRTDHLCEFADCEHVQKRTLTGEQYRARIRVRDQPTGYRSRFGLVLLDRHSEDLILEANPQGARPQSLDARGLKIELPITLEFDLYRRPDELERIEPSL